MTTRKRSVPQKSTFRELLTDSRKKLDLSENELASLLRDMLLTHGIQPAQWDRMADAYYRRLNTNSKGEVDLLKVTHDKSNMAKALAKDAIPWNRFTAAIKILGVKSYTVRLMLDFPNDITFKHEVLVRNRLYEDLPNIDDEEDEDDTDE